MKAVCVVVVCTSLILSAFAQKSTPITGEYTGVLHAPVKADQEGNVYFTLQDNAETHNPPSVLLKISRDGTRVNRFLTDNIADTAGMIDFAPSPSGDVFILSRCLRKSAQCAPVLARFNSDGQLLQSNPIEARGFSPYHVAAFPGGTLLLAGTGLSGKKYVVRAGIFSDTGKWISAVPLESAQVLRTAPAGIWSSQGPSTELQTTTADDGNVYLTQNSPFPAVFKISPSGQAVRYDLLRPESNTITNTLFWNGQMLVGYSLTTTWPDNPKRVSYKPPVWELVDLASGKTLKVFRANSYSSFPISFNKNSILSFAWVLDRQNMHPPGAVPTIDTRRAPQRYQFIESKIH